MSNVTANTSLPRADDSGPRPPDASSALKLIGLGRILQRRFEAELRGTGLTLRHFGALGHLNRNPELSYSDLARRAHVTSQSMNATVRQLEELGAVHRTSAAPGRPARLEVTDAGRRLLEAARAAGRRLDTELEAELGRTNRNVLDQILDELVARSFSTTLSEESRQAGWT